MAPVEPPEAFIEQLAGELDDAYQRTRDGLTPQHAIHDLAGRGELPVERLDALPEPASLTALRTRVDSIPPIIPFHKTVMPRRAATTAHRTKPNPRSVGQSSTHLVATASRCSLHARRAHVAGVWLAFGLATNSRAFRHQCCQLVANY
jgi:hypothetical protein